jgi:hypothetical protein
MFHLVQCHHIVQEADGGDSSWENCIPLCPNCHGWVKSYNPRHPIGNQISEKELQQRRNNFYARMNPSTELPARTDPELLDITPKDLENLFKEQTDVQAQKQIAPFIGKWMRVDGPLGDFSSDGRLLLANHHYPATIYNVWMKVNARPWIDLLSEADKGTHLTVQGQICFVNRLAVQLIYCELLDWTEIPSAPESI